MEDGGCYPVYPKKEVCLLNHWGFLYVSLQKDASCIVTGRAQVIRHTKSKVFVNMEQIVTNTLKYSNLSYLEYTIGWVERVNLWLKFNNLLFDLIINCTYENK